MRKRIALDIRMLKHTGIGTYLSCLIPELIQNNHFQWTLLGPRNFSTELRGEKQADFLECHAPIYSFREQWEIAQKSRPFDLFHAPHYNTSCGVKPPLVLTVHDLTHFRFPEYVQKKWRVPAARWLFQTVCRKARKVIAVSQATKNDLLHFFKIDENKIRVIVEGGGQFQDPSRALTHFPEIQKKYQLPSSYMIYIGALKPHKNIARLLEAFHAYRQKGISDIHLVLIGWLDPQLATPRIRRLLFETEGIHYLGFLPRNELEACLAGSSGLILPSLWEGFGLPILEAFSYSIPVACSDIPAHREVAGKQGLYFNPESELALEEAIRHLAEQRDLRERLIRSGTERLSHFSWKKCAEETLEIYQEALEG